MEIKTRNVTDIDNEYIVTLYSSNINSKTLRVVVVTKDSCWKCYIRTNSLCNDTVYSPMKLYDLEVDAMFNGKCMELYIYTLDSSLVFDMVEVPFSTYISECDTNQTIPDYVVCAMEAYEKRQKDQIISLETKLVYADHKIHELNEKLCKISSIVAVV